MSGHYKGQDDYNSLRELCAVTARENKELRVENQRLRDALERIANRDFGGVELSPDEAAMRRIAGRALAGDAE
jgi:hypothetical protein